MDILTANRRALRVISDYGLHTTHIDVRAGAHRREPDGTCTPVGHTSMLFSTGWRPTELIRWGQFLDVCQVHLHRRQWDTTVTLQTEHDGVRWTVTGSFARPSDGSERHPGVKITWSKNRGRARANTANVSLDELRTILAGLGLHDPSRELGEHEVML